ncbi:hypothetical protein GCM10009555_017900 [Acrocarpospora macrocephala]|uniref:HTH cro/C1-type domain-containing protein n=1 Tax=Acrocarpospora macrocephala TaxID=150177 RepID=A0A5M3WGN2_9ACTN|nr:helix-turn-helix domain-containing protein [Acrocarpospora macrocephala]GES07450.1 hypothetical protein Amac_010450 [Acrocarpospora macrocephala]
MTEAIQAILGRNVLALRTALGLTQAGLTALGLTQAGLTAQVGLTRSSIANLETGRQNITVATLEALAAALATTPAVLLAAPGTLIEAAAEAGDEVQVRLIESARQATRELDAARARLRRDVEACGRVLARHDEAGETP